ncbi:uncharacterized protein LOC100384131 [Zea mays]|uniref:Uncharacterized protein n=1 Tax=Zea mays TaxID=4577 RepID=C0PLR7_MAIZE|nr:uncharacterized protein LOC100384131 [Zea mays]ACN36133.1 unknown [Zea mays]|eukprot:NP_001170184.1 uncharacterized protein LOC100384131 [Zea mays]
MISSTTGQSEWDQMWLHGLIPLCCNRTCEHMRFFFLCTHEVGSFFSNLPFFNYKDAGESSDDLGSCARAESHQGQGRGRPPGALLGSRCMLGSRCQGRSHGGLPGEGRGAWASRGRGLGQRGSPATHQPTALAHTGRAGGHDCRDSAMAMRWGHTSEGRGAAQGLAGRRRTAWQGAERATRRGRTRGEGGSSQRGRGIKGEEGASLGH